MKVLLTVTGSLGTGSFQVANGVAKALLAQGHEAKIFFPESYLSHKKDLDYYHNHPEQYKIWRFPLENDDARLETFPLMLPGPHPRSPNAKMFNQLTPSEWALYFSSLKDQLDQLIKDFQPDIIECQHIWAMDHVVNELNYPYICVAHNSDQLAFALDPKMQTITKQSAANAQYIFAVSQSVQQQVVELYGTDQEKVINIPCGYDHNIFKPMKLDREAVLAEFNLKIPSTAEIICFCGKISRIKGVDVLLQANSYLPPDRDIHIVMLGAGDIDDVLTEEEKAKSCFDRIHLLGHRTSDEVAKINNISKLNVLPSRSEGFCVAGLEALACGTPLIMTETAGDNQCAAAAIVPSENPEELANAIMKIIDLPEPEYQQLCQRAPESAKQFTWDNIVKKRLAYYQTVLQS